MNPSIHALVLTSIAIAIFTVVMAWGWVGSIDKRLTALEQKRASEQPPD